MFPFFFYSGLEALAYQVIDVYVMHSTEECETGHLFLCMCANVSPMTHI